MKFSVASADAVKTKTDVLIVPIFESEFSDKKNPHPALGTIDKKTKGLLLKTALAEGFKGKAEQTLAFLTHDKIAANRVLVLGLGEQAKYVPETLRLALGRGVKVASKIKARTLVVQLPATRDGEADIQAVVEGMALGNYRYEQWKTQGKDEKNNPRIEKAQLVLPAGIKKVKAHDEIVAKAIAIADATNWARDLVNEPAGTMTPSILADQAKKMAKESGLHIEVLERKKIEELKMGMFLGVARGSVEEPRLVHLSWVPSDAAAAKRQPLCLVGKAITFDSGGLSLKPSDAMLDMKTDMAGSAAMLGAMKVIATLKPPFPVHGFFGACENMPSHNAYRLGDVLVSRHGKTVEITNTDAEGRLVLGDVLAWANDLKPAAIIDLATLTGACIIALGNSIAGAFSADDPLYYEVSEAARVAGEDIWRLPITESLRDVLKSEIADLKNAGDRAGGASSAALFLKEFVGQTPWLHLDIAGPSTSTKERGYLSKGASGFGVRTLVEFVARRTRQLHAEMK